MSTTELGPWRDADPSAATRLVDARLQFHHAAQLATALGISYLPAQPDDSHTNLEWLTELQALASNPVQGAGIVRLAVRPSHLAVLVLDESNTPSATLLLGGRTIEEAAKWIRGQLDAHGIDSSRYTLKRHYSIPSHPVAENAAFDVTRVADFEQLSIWYSNAASLFTAIAASTPGASVVRCWPHHFDLATLIEVAPERTVGVGMEPGDVYYAEPYFYVNMRPATDTSRPALEGGGAWHTHEWIGAVLRGSQLAPRKQRAQCEAFLRSAIAASSAMVKPD